MIAGFVVLTIGIFLIIMCAQICTGKTKIEEIGDIENSPTLNEKKIHSINNFRKQLEEIFGTRSYFWAVMPSIRSLPMEFKIDNWEFYEEGCCLMKDNEEEMGLKCEEIEMEGLEDDDTEITERCPNCLAMVGGVLLSFAR